jgi:hypothetical protein
MPRAENDRDRACRRFGPQMPEAVARGIERVFRTASGIEPIFSDLSFAFDAGRRQYHSTAILQVVERSAPAERFQGAGPGPGGPLHPHPNLCLRGGPDGGKGLRSLHLGWHTVRDPGKGPIRSSPARSRRPCTSWDTPSACATARTPPVSCTTAAANRRGPQVKRALPLLPGYAG